jgi:hypothetical protein
MNFVGTATPSVLTGVFHRQVALVREIYRTPVPDTTYIRLACGVSSAVKSAMIVRTMGYSRGCSPSEK